MRKTVSPEAREQLRDVLIRNVLTDDMEKFLDDVCEWYESQNTFSDATDSREQQTIDDPTFKGETYEKAIDQKALQKGFMKVFRFMALTHPDRWLTDMEIADETGVYVPSVQRYRSYMRSPEFGSHTVERRRREGIRVFEFRLIPNHDSLIYKHFISSSPN